MQRIRSVTHWVEGIVDWVMGLKPMRAFTHFNDMRGPLLSAGLSYRAIFAVFAGLWVWFSVAGVFIASNPQIAQAFFALLDKSVPGLIDDGSGDGIIDPTDLLDTAALTLAGAVAAVGLLLTAVGWLASGRDAVRHILGLPSLTTNFFLIKLKDLGLVLLFGAIMVVSAALTVLSTTALGNVVEWLGMDSDSTTVTITARSLGLLIAFVLDVLVLAGFYRVVSGVRVPIGLLIQSAVLIGLALGVLKALGTTLLGGASNNPLLASFATIIGLLIWFYLVCQMILLGAAWIAVSATDKGIELRRTHYSRIPSAGPPSGVSAAL